MDFIGPKTFIHLTLAKGLSVRELRTPEQASTERELGWELAVDFLILRHGFGYGFPRKTARILFRKLAWIWRGFFEPFFPCPKNPRQIHATQNPQIHAIFGNFFLSGFSGRLTRFA